MVALMERQPQDITPRDTLDRMFGDWGRLLPFRMPFDLESIEELGGFIRVDEYREGDQLIVRAELPGVDLPGVDPEKDVEVTVTDHTLHIEAERREEETEKKGLPPARAALRPLLEDPSPAREHHRVRRLGDVPGRDPRDRRHGAGGGARRGTATHPGHEGLMSAVDGPGCDPRPGPSHRAQRPAGSRTEKVAPCGSASTAKRSDPTLEGGRRTVPPRASARSAVALRLATAKYTAQCDGASVYVTSPASCVAPFQPNSDS